VAAENLDLGENQFRLNRPDQSRSSIEAHLNFIELSYSALFRARGNILRFNSGAVVGDTSLTVTGITSSTGPRLFDVTDPEHPERLGR
jgi:hypothetical protein